VSADAAPAAAGQTAAGAHDALVEALRGALRGELDEVVPHVVTALKRHDAVAALTERLDRAERRLGERDQRPLVSGLRRVLALVRRMDFEPAARDAILAELEGLLVGAGYTEFGEVGEPFDPARHDAIDGSAPAGGAHVAEVLDPGLEALGDVVVRARVRVAGNPIETRSDDEQ
jgi:hypothetical protein